MSFLKTKKIKNPKLLNHLRPAFHYEQSSSSVTMFDVQVVHDQQHTLAQSLSDQAALQVWRSKFNGCFFLLQEEFYNTK